MFHFQVDLCTYGVYGAVRVVTFDSDLLIIRIFRRLIGWVRQSKSIVVHCLRGFKKIALIYMCWSPRVEGHTYRIMFEFGELRDCEFDLFNLILR